MRPPSQSPRLSLRTPLLLIGLLLAVSSVYAQDTTPVQVCVAPASIQVVVNQTVDLVVEVRDVQALYGVDISLAFDPHVVEVIDADPSLAGVQVALGTFLDPGFVMRNVVDNAAGTLRFAMTQLNPSEPKSSSGSIIVIRLRGKQAGASTLLTLVDAALAQRDGTRLATALVSGQVEVVASAGAQPTNTPIPTQGPGTPMPTATVTPTPAPATATPTAGSETVTPTSTPTATSVPSTDTLQPTATPVPTHTPLLATSEPPTATPLLAATTASGEPTVVSAVSEPPAMPTALPPTTAPSELSPAAVDTPLPPTATPLPPAATSIAALPLPTQPGGIAVALAQPGDVAAQPAVSPGEARSHPARTFLLAGTGLLGLAILMALAFFVVWRRSAHE